MPPVPALENFSKRRNSVEAWVAQPPQSGSFRQKVLDVGGR